MYTQSVRRSEEERRLNGFFNSAFFIIHLKSPLSLCLWLLSAGFGVFTASFKCVRQGERTFLWIPFLHRPSVCPCFKAFPITFPPDSSQPCYRCAFFALCRLICSSRPSLRSQSFCFLILRSDARSISLPQSQSGFVHFHLQLMWLIITTITRTKTSVNPSCRHALFPLVT